jgi:hypothetical protein
MKTLLMYDRVVPLNRETHKRLRVAPGATGLGFARETNSMLMAASELALAALDYPCVFVETAHGHALVAIVGLRDKENLLIDAAGQWAPHCYVPAFVRRYPFVLAEQTGSDELTLCVDEAFSGLSQEHGEAVFDEQGQDTPYMQQVQQFLLTFHQDMLTTATFTNRLAELGLLVARTIELDVNGERQTLQGFKIIDEDKLRAIDPETLQSLFGAGYLGWAYAHLMSLNNTRRLGQRLAEHMAAAQKAPTVMGSETPTTLQ